MDRPGYVIIGAGVIGCSLARALARRGSQVVVVDRGAPGDGASRAAAGMLSPSGESEEGSPLFPLGRASLKLYPSFTSELLAETGIDPHYRSEGTLLVFSSDSQRRQALEELEWQRALGAPVEEVSSSQLHTLEPALAALPGALYLSEDHQVDNRLLMHALVQSCRQYGVEFLLGKSVLGIERKNGHIDVCWQSGRIEAETVINAAGAWAGAVHAPGLAALPIRPVKGHMLALQTSPGLLRHVVRAGSFYLVPRVDGRVLAGSTMEEAGFDATPRARPLTELLRAAQQLCPALEQSAIAEYWAGLRPAAPDALPLLGPSNVDHYWMALGHFRNGILLAPITAQLLSEWMLTGRPSVPADAFDPRRFSGFRSEPKEPPGMER